ncbi:MAG: type II toxin-antitoxin system VapC family toxin [Burkholderiales bacterium]
MASVLVDTGPLVALFSARDTHHADAQAWFKSFRGNLLTTWPVLTEVTHLLAHPHLVSRFMRWVSQGGAHVFELPGQAVAEITDLMERYESAGMDLADASLVWLADQIAIPRVISIDEGGFAVYRTASGIALTNQFSITSPTPRRRHR